MAKDFLGPVDDDQRVAAGGVLMTATILDAVDDELVVPEEIIAAEIPDVLEISCQPFCMRNTLGFDGTTHEISLHQRGCQLAGGSQSSDVADARHEIVDDHLPDFRDAEDRGEQENVPVLHRVARGLSHEELETS
jgi:hypothetical protein